ncbi:uncharacterized protein LOC100571942 [Acyrthosiphon pisum]|uniref:DUF4485 domain-containing protein n=1 Tax=Acyrthosiphon pisum TaxID=7029 RepID=A0A8R1W6Z6_ACYPI|nr:uncharacterized protein LOC100571942 [Acyrthosiphon pisum]|eukprot:XP_003247629.1 PREDICTED: uncharacterized protein LOC100571942 isoform X1 [Acyrthosiphon pisum]
MNNILENNEDLHEEFKTLLVKIEPHFLALKSNLEKLLCREWLHKLFKTGKHEESLRNAYLTKLFEQLVKGKLKEPFNNLPKHRSPLLPLRSVSKPNINVRDKKPIKKVEETLITDVVNVHKNADAPQSTKNHVDTKEIKLFGNVCDKNTIKKVEETLITDEVNVHKTVDAHKSMEIHVPTNEIKMLVDVHDRNTIKKEEETLITDVVNAHKTVDSHKCTENHLPTNEIKMVIDVRDCNTIKKEEETLITDELNVQKTVDATKSTDNHLPTNEIKMVIDVCDRNTIKKQEETLITDELNVHKTFDAPKSTENHVHTNEMKINENSDQAKQLNVNEIADDSKEVQWQKLTVDESEGGDGLTLNVETKLKLVSVEKSSNELKKKSDLLAEQVQEMKLYTDTVLIKHDKIIVLNTELNKFQNDIKNMSEQEAADELSVSKLLKHVLKKTTVLDNTIVSVMDRLKTIVENACASKKNYNFAIEQLKELHRLKMDEKEKFHAMPNKNFNSHLKEYVGKVEEEAMSEQLNDENYNDCDYSST